MMNSKAKSVMKSKYIDQSNAEYIEYFDQTLFDKRRVFKKQQKPSEKHLYLHNSSVQS